MNEQQEQRLEELLEVLRDRFGQGAPLGLVLTAVKGIHRVSRGVKLSISDVARLSGDSLSNVSRWLNQAPFIKLVDDPDDERRKLIEITDSRAARSHLQKIEAILADPEIVEVSIQNGQLIPAEPKEIPT
jgi:hypothetical protein